MEKMSPLVLPTLVPEFADIASATICMGMRGTILTPRGIKGLDILSSAMQKYIRRGFVVEGITFVMEWLLLGMSQTAQARDYAALLTNMRNRMVISSLEDCMHPGIYPEVLRLSNTFDDNRNNARGWSAILQLFVMLACSKKGRIPSVMKIVKDPPRDEEFAKEFASILAPTRPAARTFRSLVIAGDITAIREVNGAEQQKEAWHVLYDIVKGIKGANEVISSLHEIWSQLNKKKHTEVFLGFYQAVALVTFRAGIQSWTSVPEEGMAQHKGLYDEGTLLSTLRKHLESTDAIAVEDFVIDMHTRDGRRKQRGPLHFATVGALVTNKSTIVDAETLASFEDMYIKSKTCKVTVAVVDNAGVEMDWTINLVLQS